MTLDLRVLDDPARLQEVRDLGLIGAAPEERFDRVTRTAQRLLDVPYAFLNLVGGDAVWVASCVGFDVQEVDRDVAFCSYAIGAPGVLVVEDAALDDRFSANPLVLSGPGLRSYAGRPLRGPGGQVVGTLCVLDVRPRRWTQSDLEGLDDLADWAEAALAHRDVRRRLAEGDAVRHQYARVLASAGQGILGLDVEGVITVANPAAAALTGWSELELVGRPVHPTLHPAQADGSPCNDPDCPVGPAPLAGRQVVRRRDLLWRRDAAPVPVQLSCAPIEEDGVVTGAVLLVDDISEQQAVDRMKDEFVSVVSHELRTPLTSLRGSLGMLAAGVLGPLSAPGQQMADVAVSSTERLVRLVDDILDLERLVAGQVVLQRREHDLTDLARTAAEAVTGVARDAGVDLRLDAGEGSGWFDGDRLVQVLVNLLGNAVKFSPRGAEVALHARRVDSSVVLEVTDVGRGIPPEQLERVFDRFAQVDASDSRDRGGSGLGLAIARNVVEAHGGTISARSAVGEGSTFTVVLPQRRSPVAPRAGGRRADDAQARS